MLRRLSEISAWLCLLAVLVISVPLFVCMPLWVDTTYHDLSARNVLRGGVHYRDIFETNLPGMVWAHALIRPLIGWSSEAIRTADLVVVGASIVLLSLSLKRIGVKRSGQVWFLTAAFFFYLNESEFIHCQRDGWMLLPTVVAMLLRGRQLGQIESVSVSRLYWRAVLEGMAWACAVWIKPHALIPALGVWLVGSRWLAGCSRHKFVLDLLGLLTGGLLVGGAGVSWLVLTDAWPFMWDVLLNWNGEYYKWTPAEIDQRVSMVIMYFAPWSLIHFVALPLVLLAFIRARIWRWGLTPGQDPARLDLALLAALYLGWFLEAVLLQKVFHYSQAPVILIALALVAAQRWPIGPIFVAWCLGGGALNYYRGSCEHLAWLRQFERIKPYTYRQVIPKHKWIEDGWRELWWTCVTNGSSPEMKDRLSFYHWVHSAPTWTDLDEVKHYLETLHLRDGELLCWDDTTHPLYLEMNLRPNFRFMHVNTSLEFISKRPRLREELIASGAKYVVSDVAVVNFVYEWFPLDPPPEQPLALPVEFPCFCRDIFPWDQPIVAKCGRYWVHRLDKPINAIRIPYTLKFDKP